MNTKRCSSHNQHDFAHLIVRAEPRPLDLACASSYHVRHQGFVFSSPEERLQAFDGDDVGTRGRLS